MNFGKSSVRMSNLFGMRYRKVVGKILFKIMLTVLGGYIEMDQTGMFFHLLWVTVISPHGQSYGVVKKLYIRI